MNMKVTHNTITTPAPGLLPFSIVGDRPIRLRKPKVITKMNGYLVARFSSNGTDCS